MAGNSNSGDFSRFGNAYLPTRFRSDNQPDPENKRKGWLKKKKGRDLVKAILEMDFHDPDVRMKTAAYFNIPEEEITVEAMMHFVQIAKAINKNDTFAYGVIVERAYGKPKDVGPDEDVGAPAIVIQPVVTMQEAPPISEQESEEDGGLMPT